MPDKKCYLIKEDKTVKLMLAADMSFHYVETVPTREDVYELMKEPAEMLRAADASIVNLENVHIYNNTEAGGCIITNFMHGTTVNIKDSVLWNRKWSTFNLSKTNQTKLPENVTNSWTGPCELTINIEGSTVCSANTYFVEFVGV